MCSVKKFRSAIPKSSNLYLILLMAMVPKSSESFYSFSRDNFIIDQIHSIPQNLNMSNKINIGSYQDEKYSKLMKMRKCTEDIARKSFSVSIIEKLQNERCKHQFLEIMWGLQNSSLWAVKMFDSSSKFLSGLVTGNTYQFGNYDQCIDIESVKSSIRGKYCLAKIHFSPSTTKYSSFYMFHKENDFSLDFDPYKSVLEKFKKTKDFTKKRRNIFHLGVCVPNSCSGKDVELILNHFTQSEAKKFGYHIKVTVPKGSCSTKEPSFWSTQGKTLLLFISSVIFVVIFCTVWDLKNKFNNKQLNGCCGKLKAYVEAFSLSKNVTMFITQEGNGDMNIFNGMKILSMILVILGHRCMASCGGPFFNPQFLEERYRKFQNILFLNGTLIVDTFFLISGFLTFLILFKQYQKNQKLNFFHIYLHRWLRVIPIYMLMVFFYGYSLEHLGTGPMWSTKIGKEAQRCRQNWWANFLFINNYVNAQSLCLFQSWYVACDMHFVLLAPFIVKIVADFPAKVFLIFLSLILGSQATVFLVTFYNKYDGVLKVYITTFEDLVANFTFNRVYIKSHHRATPYFSGMAAAYMYIKLKQIHYKFSMRQVWVFSLVAVISAFSAICGAWLFYIPGREYNVLENASYASLHRLFWAVSMSWIALAGGTQGFGKIQPILSQKFFIPLSKLSYTVFLVHGAIQMYTSATLRAPEYMSFTKLCWMTCGDVALSFVLAFFLHMFFEAPIKQIQILVFSRRKTKLH